MARKGIRLKTPPAAPVPPDLAFCSAALPAWMYRDPADVVERMELQANARAERQQRERAQVRERTEEKGLSPQTVLQVRRLRIREMVKRAMEGK